MEGEVPSGFADECEEISLEVRAELGLRSHDRLDPRRLADHLAIEVAPLDRYRKLLPEEVARLTEIDPTALSAVTVFYGTKCMILVNPEHSAEREMNTIAHELAHVMLEHEPKPLFEGDCERVWCGAEENEADYLAGALLVPRDAVRPVMSLAGEDVATAAEHFGVSDAVMARRIEQCSHPLAAEARETVATEMRAVESNESPLSVLLRRLTEMDRPDDGGEPEPARTGVI
jgi:Zn-dependent peptidase ImmA (M78 family)